MPLWNLLQYGDVTWVTIPSINFGQTKTAKLCIISPLWWGIRQWPVANAHRHMMISMYMYFIPVWPLQWRHNGRDGVSNHQPHDYLLNRSIRRRSKKTSKLRVTGLCARNSPVTGEFPAQMVNYAENVSIWWRHHVAAFLCPSMHPSIYQSTHHPWLVTYPFNYRYVFC